MIKGGQEQGDDLALEALVAPGLVRTLVVHLCV